MKNNNTSYRRYEYPTHVEDVTALKDGSLKEGDLVWNTATDYCFYATADDEKTIKPDTYPDHKKFVRLIPLF